MAFQENLNASLCMVSFFRSHGSDVSHGSGCRAGFFHGYAWCSLHLGELEDVPPPPQPPRPPPQPRFFFFGANLD